MPRTNLPKGSVPVTFRLPREAKKRWAAKAWREKLSLAEFIRRALRREIEPAQGRPPRHER
ncbi:MAG TPA: ribbon-helix-helix protein, CopG family [Chthoniobacterales bacterium]|nr:ribbon-helix-helix protein, CopG family [Chthoniobacterales bacterium]